MSAGTRLGEFEITGVLGEGGFGIVYSAHDSGLDRQVAIKEYLPSALSYRASNATVQIKSGAHTKVFAAGLASFVTEARLLASFSNPSLVEVYRFWEANGTACMVMRYYEGATLQAILSATPQIASEAWLQRTLDPILLALAELHSQRCYHRDVAPDNIMVMPDGRSVLMDFGAARRIIGGMTQALTTVLKPGYAPIEQYSNDGAMHQGAWTDVYAIGALLYQAITGLVPVQAISRMANDPLVPVTELARADYSDRLCHVVTKCMAVLPTDRYQTIEALRDALGWANATSAPGSFQPAYDPEATVTARPLFAHRAALHAALQKPHEPPVPYTDLLATVAPPRPPARRPAVQAEPEGPVDEPGRAIAAAPLSDHRSRTIAAVGAVTVALVLGIGAAWFLMRPAPPRADSPAPPRSLTQATGGAVGKIAPPPPLEQSAPAAVAPLQVEPASQPAIAANAPGVQAPGIPWELSVPAPAAPVPMLSPAEAPAAATMGLLRIELKDGWATVFVNGQERGFAPPVLNIKLPPGSHEIELRNPSMPTVRLAVKVVAGKTATVRHSFTK